MNTTCTRVYSLILNAYDILNHQKQQLGHSKTSNVSGTHVLHTVIYYEAFCNFVINHC